MVCRIGLSVLALALVLTPQEIPQHPGKHAHPGVVVDSQALVGIEASVNTYMFSNKTETTPCPEYEKGFDKIKSNPQSGFFVAYMDAQQPSFTVTYCQLGYFSRTEETNDNARDNTWIQSTPIMLQPIGKDSASRRNIAFNSIRAVIRSTRGNIAYFRSVDPEGFALAYKSLPPFEQQIVTDLLKLEMEHDAISNSDRVSGGCLIVKHKGTVGRRLIWTSVLLVPIAPGTKYDLVASMNYPGSPKMAYKAKELEELEKSGVKVVVLNNNYTSGDFDTARYLCAEPGEVALPTTGPRK